MTFETSERLRSFVVGVWGLSAAVLLVGCGTAPVKMHEVGSVQPLEKPMVVPESVTAARDTPTIVANGSIFQPTAHRGGLFEDRRARLVGDLLSVKIEEKTTARSSSSSSNNRKGEIEGGITKLPGVSVTSSILPKLGVGGSSSATFEGGGETDSANAFSGTITVTVIEVLANGNLLVSGEKQIGINREVEVLQFSGVVSPKTIMPGNIVSSTRVADARLAVKGNGDAAKAQTTGWLARFFMSFLPI